MKTTMNMICFSVVLKLTSVLPGNVVVSLFFWLQVSDVSFPSRYYYKISMVLSLVDGFTEYFKVKYCWDDSLD